MFNKTKMKDLVVSERTFASITAPLTKMVSDLESYVNEQVGKEEKLIAEKADIEKKIENSKEEQAKATVTAANLKAFLDPTRVLVTKAAE